MVFPPMVIALFFLLCFCWVLGSFGYAYLKRIRNHPFADRNEIEAVYHERGASGNSDKTKFTKMGGANKCLTITVTATELWIHGSDFIAMIAQRSDLEHRIPLRKITSVEKIKKGVVNVSFDIGEGETRTLRLITKNPTALMNAIETGHAETIDTDVILLKKLGVRCWEEFICGPDSTPGDKIYIPFVDGHLGYSFLQCAGCGEIYARSVANEMYAKSSPFESVACVTCKRELSESLYPYPEQYLKKDGSIGQFEVSYKMLTDEASIVLEFYRIH
jgi:uncharacterized protein (UPF0248 family)